MQLSGLLHGAKLLRFVNFPVPEVLGPEASEAEIKAMLDRHGMVFVKPIFRGAIGKKGKAGLIGKATDLKTALAERERLFTAWLLKLLWQPYRAGEFGPEALETAAFTIFLFAPMAGSAAEIEDHLNRGRNMDTRTPASAVSFIA